MNTVFLTEGRVIQLLELGTVDAGSCLIVNADREVREVDKDDAR
jgi:hypothetical protein